MGGLTAEFSAAFSRDLKKKAIRRKWDLDELQKLVDLSHATQPGRPAFIEAGLRERVRTICDVLSVLAYRA